MRIMLVILFVILGAIENIHADTWACPGEKDYTSENKLFVAHVTPAAKEHKAKLKVFEAKDSERIPLWDCPLGNEGQPMDFFVSNDGNYVVTVNECSGRVHGGFGDYVVAFYDRKGVVRNYSLEQVLHYPDKIDKQQFRKLTRRTVSGRNWAHRPMFLDKYVQELHFCVWLTYGRRWLAWKVSNGEEVRIGEEMISQWNEKGRLWAIEYGVKSRAWRPAVEFLGRLQKPEDRAIIKSLLTDSGFHTSAKHNWKSEEREFVHYYCRSSRRNLAERILAQWDGKPTDRYHYLGQVTGVVNLPQAPKAGDRWLCIYLIPRATAEDKWYSKVPVHRLTAYFGEYSFHNRQWPGKSLPFQIQGVTPDTYRIKAVWDKAKPYNFEDNYITGPPQKGDYQSLAPTTITVEPGQTITDITIDCTHEVTDGTN